MLYVTPQVEILEVEVEKGYATSGGNSENWTESGQGGI